MDLLMLLCLAKAQDSFQHRSPAWAWALAYAVLASALGWAGPVRFAVGAVLLGLYAWGYFALLRRFSDRLGLWLAIFAAGPLLPLMVSVSLTKKAVG